MQKTGLVLAALALAACAPEIPDSNPDRGVGFGDYEAYRTPPAQTPPQVETTSLPPLSTDTTRGADAPNVAGVPAAPGVTEQPAPAAAATPPPMVAAKPVPNRTGSSGPSIIAFALATQHPVGTKMYRRSLIASGKSRAAANCAGYSSADLAQEAFLESGGPEKDRLKLDPDGDGYACGWNPTVFRQISG